MEATDVQKPTVTGTRYYQEMTSQKWEQLTKGVLEERVVQLQGDVEITVKGNKRSLRPHVYDRFMNPVHQKHQRYDQRSGVPSCQDQL